MSLIRWEPFRDTDEFFRSLSPAFLGRWPRPAAGDAQVDWLPAADISENDTEYLVKTELAGVPREDVKVSLQEGILTIEGERKQEKVEKNAKLHRVERSYGSFARSFKLPGNTDAAQIRAECKDGILLVHVPKVKTEKPKATQIKVD